MIAELSFAQSSWPCWSVAAASRPARTLEQRQAPDREGGLRAARVPQWYEGAGIDEQCVLEDQTTLARADYDLNKHLGYAAWSEDGVTWHSPIMLEGTFGHYLWRAGAFGGKACLC